MFNNKSLLNKMELVDNSKLYRSVERIEMFPQMETWGFDETVLLYKTVSRKSKENTQLCSPMAAVLTVLRDTKAVLRRRSGVAEKS